MINEKDFKKLSKPHQNILKWVSVSHDLKKLGLPSIYGRDHIHPFKTAIAMIDIFFRKGMIHIDEDSKAKEALKWKQIKRLLRESLQPLPAIVREDFRHGKPVCTVMHSHQNLAEIFFYLWGS